MINIKAHQITPGLQHKPDTTARLIRHLRECAPCGWVINAG
jgi:hypothetical protein